MRRGIVSFVLALTLCAGAVAQSPPPRQDPNSPAPATVKPTASVTDPYLAISVDELEVKMGKPQTIVGYESFSWFSKSKAYTPDLWPAVRDLWNVRADAYLKKATANELLYEFRIVPDARASRFRPTMRVDGYSISFDRPVPMRDLLTAVPELAVYESLPVMVGEEAERQSISPNAIVVQVQTAAAEAVASAFKADDELAVAPALKDYRFGPQLALVFVDGRGIFSATGDTRVERVIVGAGVVGNPTWINGPLRSDARSFPSLREFLNR